MIGKLIDADFFLQIETERCGGIVPVIGTCISDNFSLKERIESAADALTHSQTKELQQLREQNAKLKCLLRLALEDIDTCCSENMAFIKVTYPYRETTTIETDVSDTLTEKELELLRRFGLRPVTEFKLSDKGGWRWRYADEAESILNDKECDSNDRA